MVGTRGPEHVLQQLDARLLYRAEALGIKSFAQGGQHCIGTTQATDELTATMSPSTTIFTASKRAQLWTLGALHSSPIVLSNYLVIARVEYEFKAVNDVKGR